MIAAVRATFSRNRVPRRERALGIIAANVRGVLAPALVTALGRANWWPPGRHQDADVAAYEALRRDRRQDSSEHDDC